MRGVRLLCLSVATLLAACANPYAQNYVDRTGGADLSKTSSVIVTKSAPQIVRGGNNSEADYQTMFGDGFMMLGYASFNGRAAPEYMAREQAEAVKAERVLLYFTATGATQVFNPVTVSNTESTTTEYSGSRGSGKATTTVTDTKTKMVPEVVPLYDQLATFWIRSNTPIFGVEALDLTTEQRAALQSNKGVSIRAIQKRSPAYEADFLNGDILRTVGGSEISESRSFYELLAKYAGQRVKIGFIRNGRALSKEVQLNAKP